VVRLAGGDPSNHLRWRYDSDNGYADGGRCWSADAGGSWDGPHAFIDMLFRTYAVALWSWPDVQSLDCDVEQNDVSKGNTMHCGEVQIRVTYEPSGPPPEGQPFRIRMFGIPTAPGIRHGGSPWN